jgi:hypothetical protein
MGRGRGGYWFVGILLFVGLYSSMRLHARYPQSFSDLLFGGVVLIFALLFLLLTAGRFRELGLSGWWAAPGTLLTLMAPPLGILIFVVLGILKRDQIDYFVGRPSGSAVPAYRMPDAKFMDSGVSPGKGPVGAREDTPRRPARPVGSDLGHLQVMTEGKYLGSGSLLYGYRIVRLLGEGGFGLTYLAQDVEMGRPVVLKEFYPDELVSRKRDGRVRPGVGNEKDYHYGLSTFRNEAKILARFDHPSIVKILSYFEANDTGYIVMEYLQGEDLGQVLDRRGRFRDGASVLEVVMPILEGLKEVHRHHFLHRDIKPSNILLCPGRLPTLIDFGASRELIGRGSTRVTTILTAGYAPPEQYGSSMEKQGPWTDLYAVGAVMYRMITGEAPPDAQGRSYQLLQNGRDPCRPLRERKPGGFSPALLSAVDRALALRASERPQSVEEFQREIIS